jgi:beta-glucanase (GH16 family)
VDTFIGGSGSNIYYVESSSDIIQQAASAGIGTVYAPVNYTLPANVQDLILTNANTFGTGNSLNNIIEAENTGQVLNGGGGDDVLVGGPGHDTYVLKVGAGSDTIYNFQSTDKIQLPGYGIDVFSQIESDSKQVGADTLITLSSSQSILLKGVQASSLTAGNFELGLDTSHLQLTFHDEFSGLSLYNAATKTGTWSTSYGTSTTSAEPYTLETNGETELYVNSSFAGSGKTSLNLNPFSDSNGVLTITASEVSAADSSAMWGYKIASGLLTTKSTFSQEYGYFEMRAKLPATTGMWPAFWLLPANGSWPPEIDIMENLGNPSVTSIASHSTTSGNVQAFEPVSATADGYHTYGLSWTATALTWYVDGVEVYTEATPADMHQPMYMLVNLATGGWAGNTSSTFTSASMEVDYVRAYQYTSAVVAANAYTPAVASQSLATMIAPTNGSHDYNAATTSAGVNIYVSTTGTNTIEASKYGGSIYLGTGTDLVHGSGGTDIVYANTGIFRAQGGAGDTSYVFSTGTIASAAANGGNLDDIIDFHGAGLGNAAGSAQHDVLAFSGFGAGTTLVFDHNAGNNPNTQIYHLIDPTNTAHSGYIEVQMASSGTAHLVAGDYLFY